MNTIEIQVQRAFRQLRASGYLARANYLCCNSCAGYALADQASALKDKGRDVRGVVFYHQQNRDQLRRGHDLFLSFGSVDTDKHGEIGIPTEQTWVETVVSINSVGREPIAIAANSTNPLLNHHLIFRAVVLLTKWVRGEY